MCVTLGTNEGVEEEEGEEEEEPGGVGFLGI